MMATIERTTKWEDNFEFLLYQCKSRGDVREKKGEEENKFHYGQTATNHAICITLSIAPPLTV
jgi:hypothetical protein